MVASQENEDTGDELMDKVTRMDEGELISTAGDLADIGLWLEAELPQGIYKKGKNKRF